MPALPPAFDQTLLELIRNEAGQNNAPDATLQKIFSALVSWRAGKTGTEIAEKIGHKVMGGPFHGLAFPPTHPLACYLPKLLGIYELEIHGFVAEALQQDYDAILNIGCAEGYYALGFALKMPRVEVYAHDISEEYQKICCQLAELNGVSSRVHTGGIFNGADFAKFSSRRALVICDIEGAEKDLLNPAAFPALKNMDVIVECHEGYQSGLRAELTQRFSPTHNLRWAEPTKRWGRVNIELPNTAWDDLDTCLATYEKRGSYTCWGYFRNRAE